MGSPDELLARCDQSLRAPEFGELREAASGEFVVMAFRCEDDALWRLWIQLPAHRNIVQAVTPGWIRYAAIDWRFRIPQENHDVHLATRGYELTWPCERLLRMVPATSLREFVAPRVFVDVHRDARLVFVSAGAEPNARLPPEVPASEDCDERAFVFVVARMMCDLDERVASASTPLGDVVRRSLDPDPSQRYARLGELRDALRLAGSRRVPLPGLRSKRDGWTLVEDGIGFLQFGNKRVARRRFHAAMSEAETLPLARMMLEATPDVLADTTCTWTDAEPVAREREKARDFRGAISIYERVRPETADVIELNFALARCYFASGSAGHAADYAERVLQASSSHPEALSIRSEALLRCERAAEALDTAASWALLARDDGRAHYTLGKCLLRLGRLVDARAAFERACVLQPKLVEALVLRREVDRQLRRVRETVGTPAPMGLDIPEHLSVIRAPIEAGLIRDAVAILEADEHATDPAAQRLLGELNAFDGELDAAITAFDRAASLDPARPHLAWLGKARLLLDSSRADEALALFDRVHAERPDLTDAIAGRAKALQLLGRDREAEDALGHYLNTST